MRAVDGSARKRGRGLALPPLLEAMRKELCEIEGWASMIPNQKKVEADIKNRYVGGRSGSVSSTRSRSSVQYGNATRTTGGNVRISRSHLNPAKIPESDARVKLAALVQLKEDLAAFASTTKGSRHRRTIEEMTKRCDSMERKIQRFLERLWPPKDTQ